MSEEVGVQRIVRVLPDVPAIDKEFDYLVPDGVAVQVGDVVRIQLHGRRVGGWIVAVDVEPVAGVELKPLAKVSGRGPSAELIDLAGWAAHRWVGRRASFLRTAAPPGVARGDLRPSPRPAPGLLEGAAADPGSALARALVAPRAVLRLGPGADRYPLVRAVVEDGRVGDGGQALVLCPSVAEAQQLGRRLRGEGVRTAIVAHDRPGAAAVGDWQLAASGAAEVVVGARAAAWAPVDRLRHVVVLDEHDEVYQQEQAPTWHARAVVAERAARAGARCLVVSPCPSLEALAWGELLVASRPEERAAWPRVEVIDQRELDPALGPLFSPRLVALLRGQERVLCVLNRTGRARLLACRSCSSLARCHVCEASVSLEGGAHGPTDGGSAVGGAAVGGAAVGGPADGTPEHFACHRCGAERPPVCTTCGGTGFKNLRLGVSRAREELEALALTPVAEVTASTPDDDPAVRSARVLVGTEAVLHRVPRAGVVAFMDFDQELLALRYRAAEQAMALLCRAGRLVRRGAGEGGIVLVQTRTPDHPVLVAARTADPGRMVDPELALRAALGLPPAVAMALVSGEAAPAFVEALGRPDGVAVQGPVDGAWRIRAPDHAVLTDALAAVERPPGRLRLEVDPLRS